MADLSGLRLCQYIWPLQSPKRPRTKPMQVLALGLPRTGTDSLRVALQTLGYDWVYHGFDHVDDPRECVTWLALWRRKKAGEKLTAKDFDEVLGHAEAVTDMPACIFAPDLINAYPEAKIIINHRPDMNSWQRSIVNTWSSAEKQAGWIYHILVYFHARMFWLSKHESEITQMGLFRGSYRERCKDAYLDHYSMLDIFSPPERTLKWTVQEGWDPLCRFLGKPVPDQEFPNRNALAAVLERVMNSATKDGQAAFLRMAMSFGISLGLLAIWISSGWRML